MTAPHSPFAEEFASLWNDGPPPDVFEFLSGQEDLSPEETILVLMIDLSKRRVRGLCYDLGDYFANCQDVAENSDLVLVLIRHEMRLRREHHDTPLPLDGLAMRFPAIRERMLDAETVALENDLSRFGQSTDAAHLKDENAPDDHFQVSRTSDVPKSTTPPVADTPRHSAKSSDNDRNEVKGVRRFGDYELLGEIARGGMGVVYKARQIKLNRVVALKMILSGELAGLEEVQRFKTEAEAAANLDHSGIVPVFEIGERHGQHFFSMGFVEGESLAERLKRGPLPPADAAKIMLKVSEAVAFAHRKGVIHRDLKPANVLLDSIGLPRVTDFGLAKQVQSENDLTTTGAVMGTPSYMSPEQAAGRTGEVGAGSDIYSLGAVLYEMLTGRPVFRGASLVETLTLVLEQEPVAPRKLNYQLPPDLEAITMKCLQKRIEDRYSSADELAQDVKRFLNNERVHAAHYTFMYALLKRLGKAETCAWLSIGLGVTGMLISFVFMTFPRRTFEFQSGVTGFIAGALLVAGGVVSLSILQSNAARVRED